MKEILNKLRKMYSTLINRMSILILFITFLIIISSIFLIIFIPKELDSFSEFYLLGKDGVADNYPTNLKSGKNATIKIGIVNHENKKINYFIELWLINQTVIHNEKTNRNESIYHEMYFIDKINVTLESVPINNNENWETQWEINYTFNINKTGKYKLVFLLYKDQTEVYKYDKDYSYLAKTKISNSYKDLFIWINII